MSAAAADARAAGALGAGCRPSLQQRQRLRRAHPVLSLLLLLPALLHLLQYSNGSSGVLSVSAAPSSFCPSSPCAAGWYLPGLDDSQPCMSCPAGSSCAGGCTTLPVQCDLGTYSLGGATGCESCPAGSKCPARNAKPVLCDPGTATSADSSSCTPCAEGSFADASGAATCAPCPPGHQCLDPSLAPVVCAKGTFSLGESSTCSSCPVGTWSNAQSSACEACPDGYSCLDPSAAPVACDEGTYSTAGSCSSCPAGSTSLATSASSSCTPCPAGKACPGGGGAPMVCAEGSYAEEGASSCTQCPAGYACPSTTALPVVCAAGTFALQGSLTCTTCPLGTACTTTGSTTLCVSGQYSLAGVCTACPAGFFCPSPFVDPIPCPSGSFAANTGSTSCTTCPAGQNCTFPDANPTPCATGRFSLGADTSCTDCPPGHQCPDPASAPVACALGRYAVATNNVACHTCPPGYACPSTTVAGTVCASGYFASGNDNIACTPCPPGQTCLALSGPTGVNCTAGTYNGGARYGCLPCPAGSQCPYPDEDLVQECAAGYYSLAGSNQFCTACPIGHACPVASMAPQVCASGTYALGAATRCLACPAGSACGSSGVSISSCVSGQYAASGSSECTWCPAGFACPTPSISAPFPCITGTYSLGNATACTPCMVGASCLDPTVAPVLCDPGTFRTDLTTATCASCPAGFQCPDGQQAPLPCPLGWYSFAGAFECLLCPEGSSCPSRDGQDLLPCAAGTYSPGGLTACIECPAGVLCPQGTANATELCPAGYWCRRGTGPTGTPCPAGTWRNETGGAFLSDCWACPANYSCPAGTGTIVPQPCADGHYCPPATRDPRTYPCLPGTYMPSWHLVRTAPQDCLPCPEGFYCPSGTADPLPCRSGTFCPVGSIAVEGVSCPLGTWSSTMGAMNNSVCTNCTMGQYCPSGASAPVPCPPGSYNPSNNSYLASACRRCDASRSCSTFGLPAPDGDCALGHYCPEGTVHPEDTRCPAGRYSDATDNFKLDDCDVCLAGKACAAGSTSVDVVSCAPGHYCPAGTGSPTMYPCPAGTMYPGTDGDDIGDCGLCTEGFFCSGVGNPGVSGRCSAGFYCPSGTNSSNQFPCDAGTYLDLDTGVKQGDCKPCPLGSFCPVGVAAPIACAAGTYTDQQYTTNQGRVASTGLTSSFPSCASCPAGKACTSTGLGAADVTCGVGSYSPFGSATCIACPQGYYCDVTETTAIGGTNPPKPCPAGSYCPSGSGIASSLPSCTKGHYCPLGSVLPLKCPLGSYNPDDGSGDLSACRSCPAGSYCNEGEQGVSDPCAPGYFCPMNSTTPYAVPCPAGYHRPTPGAAASSDCAGCPEGRYCPRGSVEGLECPVGFYCTPGLPVPTPCPKGTYGNISGLTTESACVMCDPGSYCDQAGLSAPSGLCDPGFYCSSGATSSQPSGLDSTGGPCPRGGYCTQGSFEGRPCPAGTYLNVSGASDKTLCQLCPPGYYCANTANAGPSGECDPGYYCTGASDSPIQHATPAGSFSLNGSAGPTPCPVGTYAPGPTASMCLDCEPGYFCPNQSTIFMSVCPKGSFCPRGAPFGTSCEPGSYNPSEGSNNASACIDCPAGYYCADYGLDQVSGPCQAGFFCAGRAVIAAPAGAVFGGVTCPKGYYCPAATPAPLPCAPGSYGASNGLTSQSECTGCPAGSYCAQELNTVSDGSITPWMGSLLPSAPQPCATGYYCTGNASSPTANSTASDGSLTGGPCPPGYYCPSGSVAPRPCLAGTYTDLPAQGSCLPCPAGAVCPFASSTGNTSCSRGYVCLPGTQSPGQYPCPLGTYGLKDGARDYEEGCAPCTPGHYCSSLHAIMPTDECTAGFYCPIGATDPHGTQNVSNAVAYSCPKGYYCPMGATVPLPCPVGSWRNATGGTAVETCAPCTPGQYCGAEAMLAPSGPCDPGYYCTSNSSSATPLGGGPAGGDQCPPGYKCPLGSVAPTACSAGTYQDQFAQSVCKGCPEGFFCLGAQVTPQECPKGYWCPAGSTLGTTHPCPAGTYQPMLNRTSPLECQVCPPGSYCLAGAPDLSGPCAGGYYCPGNNTSPTPLLTRCAAGTFCPSGSTAPTPCLANTSCPSPGMSATGATCEAGWYCPTGSTNARQVQCPVGHWCPGDSQPVPCVPGTYNPTLQASTIGACLPCTAGFECAGYALSSATVLCREGYSCPLGTVIPDVDDECPRGHECPLGSPSATPCPAGHYQNQTAQAFCPICPASYNCTMGTIEPQLCAKGAYCPEGSVLASNLCPATTYLDREGASSEDDCQPCAGGYFCMTAGATTPQGDGPCAEGFYCEGASNSDRPVNQVVTLHGRTFVNDECPEGNYCPPASNSSRPCPQGTFASGRGNINSDACMPCPRGQYCEGTGASTAGGALCAAGYLCVSGAFVPRPHDGITGFPCPAGTFCLEGARNTTLCPPGTANPTVGNSSCPPCEAGYFCSDYGQTAGYPCPLGSYCPTGTTIPYGCPVGSFGGSTGLRNASECTLCPVGSYCPGTNLTASSSNVAPCAPGWFCDLGSASARPDGPGTLEGSGRLSGPCPAGHWCPGGTLAPQPCRNGTFLPANSSASSGDDCLLCTPGMYCGGLGLAQPSGPCWANYTCPLGSSTPNEVDCPAGQFCVAGSAVSAPCPNGTYTNQPRQGSCQACPERKFCINSPLVPADCPAQFYCPEGTAFPLPCPDGTFSTGDAGSLARASECAKCPAGVYCTNGAVRGNCSAGWWCRSGSAVPQPSGAFPLVDVGGLCPAGSYCPAGTELPIPCPADTLRNLTGAAAPTDCVVCPSGYTCLSGDPIAQPCPTGSWCPSTGVRHLCPVGTYQPLLAQTNLASCLTCPAGYSCVDAGVADYKTYPCPPGQYCPANQGNMSYCPPGTFREQSMATVREDCLECDGGTWCGLGASHQNECQGGTYCPPGSEFTRPCPATSYCPGRTAYPLTCPGGWYCPANSTNPLYCVAGQYCPPGSAEPLYCSTGFISLSIANRSTLELSCRACEAGYYSSDARNSSCGACDAGYVCTGASSSPRPLTVSQGGYICPLGHYCPEASPIEMPCPAGSYNALVGGESLAACLLCPENTFQDLAGQSGCKPCTASSGSPPGATQCACIGANRAFQSSDQSCICRPGFEFISDAHRLSEEDDVVDCQPIIYTRCASGQARDSQGRCVDAQGADCSTTQCNGSPGKFSVPLGVCECQGQPSLDTVCGADCRASTAKLSFSNDRLTVTNPLLVGTSGVNSSYSVSLSSIPGFIGAPDCRVSTCNFYSVVVREGGVGGMYGAPPALTGYASSQGINGMVTQASASKGAYGHYELMSESPSASRAGRSLSESTLYDGATATLNPSVICLVSGEGLLFDVSAASSGHYPVYLKDSLLNSNPQFDYGYFRNLSSAVASNASGVSLFAFTFHTPGVYVFADQADTEQISIVRVVEVDQQCPVPNGDPLARIQPFLFEALISNGVQRNQQIVITPDWALLGIMVALIALLVALIVAGLYFFQTHSWSAGVGVIPGYKKLALQKDLDVWSMFSSKGTIRSVDNVSKGLISLRAAASSGQGDAAASGLATGTASRRPGAMGMGLEADDGTGSARVASAGFGGAAGDDGLGSLMSGTLSTWENGAQGALGEKADPNDQWMNELSSQLDLDGFDFHSLYKMLDETRLSVEGHFEHQEDGLRLFYERMAMEIDHLKNVLAVKMQVQLHKTGEGMSEAVDRLVSGELLARQAFQDLHRRREMELTKTLEQLVTSIRNLNEDYQLYPIKELVRLCSEHIQYAERGLEQERNRRKIFASHTEIVGRPIVDALSKADLAEEGVQNSYMDALKLYEQAVLDATKKMLVEEQAHATAMEKLDESATDKRTLEVNKYHLTLCRLAKEIQQQLSYLDENLTPILESLRDMEDKTHQVWVHVQGELLEARWAALLHPTEGRLFRGINPELAKVLTGLLGMKGGLAVDPLTGCFGPKVPYDPSDPFETIFDYQAAEKAAREREGESDLSDSDDETGKRRKKGKTDADDGEESDGSVTGKKKHKKTDSDLDSDDDTATGAGGRRRKKGGLDDDEDAAAGGSTDGAGADGGEDEDDSTAVPTSSEEMRARAMAGLDKKRRQLEEDDTLAASERAERLAALDAELATLKQVFGDSTQALLEEFDRGQKDRADELALDEAAIEQLKADLLTKHQQLAALESSHSAEEAALLKQLDREDAEADDSFAVNISNFNTLLDEIKEESGDGAAGSGVASRRGKHKKIQLEDGSYDDTAVETEVEGASYPGSGMGRRGSSSGGNVGGGAGSTFLNEFEFVINDLRNKGASDEAIKTRITEMHATKRAQLREKRLAALREKHAAEAEAAREAEDATKQALQEQIKDASELQVVMEALKAFDSKNGEPGAHGASTATMLTGEDGSGGTAELVVLDPASAAEFERNRQLIERRYRRDQLDREARNAVTEAYEYARLEMRQELMVARRLRAKQEASGDDSKQQTEDELRDVLKNADNERANLDAAQERERALQRKKLQERLAAQKKAQSERQSKKKDMELRAEQRKLEEASKGLVRSKEDSKIREALLRVTDEGSRRKMAKRVIEVVMAPRFAREIEQMMGDQLEERMAFVAEEVERLQREGLPLNFIEIEQNASAKFDEPHAHAVAAKVAEQRSEVRSAYAVMYPDEDFGGEEWVVQEVDAVADYAARRRALTSKNKLKQGDGEGDETERELQRISDETALAKQKAQKAHEARLAAEQEQMRLMELEFEQKEAARKAKRAALEEEQRRRELDLLSDLSEGQREDILNQHRLNLRNYERAVDNERVKQAGLLEKSLQERRRQMALLKAKRKAALEKEKLQEKQMAKRIQKKMMKKLKEQSISATTDMWRARAAAAMGGAAGGVPGMALGGLPIAELDEEDGGAGYDSDDGVARHKKRLAKEEAERKEAQEKQEVLTRLRTIEGLVEKIQGQADQWRGQIFVDGKDATDPAYQPRGSAVEVCPVSALDAKAMVLYRFGVHLSEVLFARGVVQAPVNGVDARGDSTPVHMLIASSLPPNPHKQTAFHNSFSFDAQHNILFLRKERLEDVGEFLLVLCHCLAHISTSARAAHAGLHPSAPAAMAPAGASSVGVIEGWDDRNPAFVEVFHRCLKFICADIFYANANKALQAAPHVLPLVEPLSSPPIMLSAPGADESQEGVPKGARGLVEGLSPEDSASWLGSSVRQLAIDELLDLHPLSGLSGVHPSGDSLAGAAALHSSAYNTARMLERMDDYHAFQHASELKANLTELEKNVRAREHAREIKEARSFHQRAAKGVPPPTPNDDKSWQVPVPRSGAGPQGLAELRDLEDDLTGELSSIAEQLYSHTQALHQAERDARDLRLRAASAGGAAADKAALSKLEGAIQSEQSVLAQLNRHKDQTIYRLRNVQHASRQIEGDEDADAANHAAAKVAGAAAAAQDEDEE